MPSIKQNSLEEALLFLTHAIRAGQSGDPRSAEWLVHGTRIVADLVNASDPRAGTAAALVSQMLLPLGGNLPGGHQFLNEREVREGWLHFEHKSGREAICRDGQATFASNEVHWYRTGPLEFSAN